MPINAGGPLNAYYCFQAFEVERERRTSAVTRDGDERAQLDAQARRRSRVETAAAVAAEQDRRVANNRLQYDMGPSQVSRIHFFLQISLSIFLQISFSIFLSVLEYASRCFWLAGWFVGL